jgi:hypothetical protein
MLLKLYTFSYFLIFRLFYNSTIYSRQVIFFFLAVKGPAADATDPLQPWGLLCNPMMKMMIFFVLFLVMEHRWNEIDRGKPKNSGKNLSQYRFVQHKSHMDWPGIEPAPPRWEAGG